MSVRHSVPGPPALPPREGELGASRFARQIPGQCDGEMPGQESQPAVEPDVFDSARHGLEADRLHRFLVQQSMPDLIISLPADALTVGTHRQQAHPPFAARKCTTLEAYQFTITITPHHRRPRVLRRIAPDQGIEVRHPDAEQPVAADSDR